MTRISSRLGPILLAGITALGVSACGDDSPEQPGAPLEVDGESPLITDPAGVANDLTD